MVHGTSAGLFLVLDCPLCKHAENFTSCELHAFAFKSSSSVDSVLSFRKHWRLFFLLRQDSLTRSGSKSKVLADICNHCFAWVILSTRKSGKNIPKLPQRDWTPAQPRGRNTALWFGIQSFGNRGCVLLGKIQELFLFPLSCCLNNRLCFVKCLRNQGGASERSDQCL